MLKLPLLMNHDINKPIGAIVQRADGRFEFNFTDDVRITDEILFDVFGGVGILVTEMVEEEGVRIIKAGQILEFSCVAEKRAA